ncbi:MAG: hypothetical protein JNM41_11005 [Flavipsychrobacter sp.]|nr:hypothetical protein [Flavipsychrobacter sp.]
MNNKTSLLLGTTLLALLPHFAFAAEVASGSIETMAFVISIFNLVLSVTALLSIKQYFWPGVDSTSVFHTAHIIFVVVFYAVSLPFLISNRQYYVEYADLVPLSILGKFFFSADATSLMQLVIVASVVFNILFIRRSKRELERPYMAAAQEEKTIEKQVADDKVDREEAA